MAQRALLVGGTGPTGPHVVRGLLERGYEVALFHRGSHEAPEMPEVVHLHGDPHFSESIEETVGRREFDLVIAAYGRTKLLARHFASSAGQFISVGGAPRYAGYYAPEVVVPRGPAIPISETSAPATEVDPGEVKAVAFGHRMIEVEREVFAQHPSATHLIYPILYGPRNVVPREWSIVKRVLDGRKRILLPDSGLGVHCRGSGRNVAQFMLLAVDHPEAAAGQVFNCADSVQYSLRQWAELLARAAGRDDVEFVGVPAAVAPYFASVHLPLPSALCDHSLYDISKATRLLGYRDAQAPEDAVDELVEWYARNPVEAGAYPTFVDTFDYSLEDEVMEDWERYLRHANTRFPGFAEDAHPMAHPKRLGEGDAKGR